MVRKSLTEAIAVVATICLPANQWPELLAWLVELGAHDNVVHRQTSMKILDALVNQLGGAFALQFDDLQPVLARALGDSDVHVQLSALRRVGVVKGRYLI